MDTIDGLPPEARFLLRGIRAGLSLDDAAALIALDAAEAAKRLRGAAARAGTPLPAAAAGGQALLTALEPLLERAARPPGRSPSTVCLSADVARSLATRRLAGPLLLASAEHAADCPACLARVLALRGDTAEDVAPAQRRPSSHATTIVVVVVVVIVALLLLLLV